MQAQASAFPWRRRRLEGAVRDCSSSSKSGVAIAIAPLLYELEGSVDSAQGCSSGRPRHLHYQCAETRAVL